MRRATAAVAMALIAVSVGQALHAQAPTWQSTMLQRAPVLPRFSYEPEAELDAPSAPRYRPNHWKTGALIGGAVGLTLSTVIVATCDESRDAGECPSWNRVPIATVLFAGVGAAISLFVPAGAPRVADSMGIATDSR